MYVIENDKRFGFGNDNTAFLQCFLNTTSKAIGRRYRMGMIILPSGGYSVIEDREMEPVAVRYQGYGVQCFVLNYSTGKKTCYVDALRQLGETIELIRENADRWDIDPDRIVLCGFSAGAHLAAGFGCYGRLLSQWIGTNVRPNALMLGYPVITSGEFAHFESIENCLKDERINKESISFEAHVGEDMPPVFLWACADDTEVSIQNALLFSNALASKEIPFELHIFKDGGHGLALGDECTARVESQINENYAKWFELSLKWLREVL